MNADTEPWNSDWKKGDAIGGGGQGTTYQATRLSDGLSGVIKLLKYQTDMEARRRMYREVTNLKILESVGCKTPGIYSHNTDQFEVAGTPLYFVMEYVKGESLASCIKRLKGLSLEQSVSLVLDVCATFRTAINQNVLHRDLKPENVIVRGLEPPDLVIVDYGLSFNHTQDDDLTRVSEALDNKFISLPERRVPGGNRRDPRSDITGICAILFYCLMGESPVDLFDANGRPPHRRHGRSVKEKFGNDSRASQIEVLFDRAFAQSIDNRFQSIDELEQRLAELTLPTSHIEIEDPSVIAKRYGELLFKHDRKTQLAAYTLVGQQVLKDIANTCVSYTKNIAPFIASPFAPFNVGSPPQADILELSHGIQICVMHNNQQIRIIYEIAARGNQCGVFRVIHKMLSPDYDKWEMEEDWTAVMWYDALEVPDTSLIKADCKKSIVRSFTLIQEDILNLVTKENI